MAYPVTSISLGQNTITPALFNMIISQKLFGGNVAGPELADMCRVDGTMFGDTKICHSFDSGAPEDWGNDAEAADLLKLNRNKSGKTQTIKMGVYKMIYISTDRYLSKQAFTHEGNFAEYISFLQGSLRKIKKVYDRALINNKICTLDPSTPACDINIVTPLGATKEETNRLEAQTMAEQIEILEAELEDNSRDYNKLGYLRAWDASDFIAVWNVNKKAKIKNIDLPSLFHNDIKTGGGFKEYKLPQKWFGVPAGADLTLPTTAPAEITNRILVSGWYDLKSGEAIELKSKPDANCMFLWAGDAVPYKGQEYKDEVRRVNVKVTAKTLAKELYYTVDKTIAFMLIHKGCLPFMSGFEVGTEFWNARALTSTNYLIFGHNKLEFIEEYPRLRIRVTQETNG